MLNNFAFCFVVFIFTFFILILPVFAINMESPRYRIQFGNLNSASGNKASEDYHLSDTVGQLAAGKFDSDGYIIKAGFQYVHSIIPFRFTVTDTTINFGTLSPQTFATAQTNLIVSFGSAGNYQVTAAEEAPLRTLAGNTISNTRCNTGSNTCTESLARPWTSPQTYGFGYHIEGDDTPTDFLSPAFFRPFPDLSTHNSPAVIMRSENVGKNRQSTVTFKVNVSPDQSSGTYQTVISFIATPSF